MMKENSVMKINFSGLYKVLLSNLPLNYREKNNQWDV